MNVDEKPRSRRHAGPAGPAGSWAHRGAVAQPAPDPHSRGIHLFLRRRSHSWGPGSLHQVNLILLVFTLSAGPFLASIFGGRAMLHRLNVQRRLPPYVFSGEPLVIDYTVENGRRWFAALAVFLEDRLLPLDRSIRGADRRDPEGILRAGRRSRSRCVCAGTRRAPSAASISFAIWIWAPARRSVWSSTASRSPSRIKCWCIPGSAI